MTRGERHAYEEHLTNVVILEDASRRPKRSGSYNPATPPGIPMIAARHLQECGPTFAGTRAGNHGNAGRRTLRDLTQLAHLTSVC